MWRRCSIVITCGVTTIIIVVTTIIIVVTITITITGDVQRGHGGASPSCPLFVALGSFFRRHFEGQHRGTLPSVHHRTLAQKAGPNGGLLAGKDGHEAELVVAPAELTLYIIDGGKAHSTKGVKVRGVIQQAGKNPPSTSRPPTADDKKLVAKLAQPLA